MQFVVIREIFRKPVLVLVCVKRSALGGFVAAVLATLSLTVPNASTAETRFLVGGKPVEPLDIFRDCAECPEMIMLPMGSFTMGAELEESRALARFFPTPAEGEPPFFWHEGPPHRVRIDRPIAMGRNEVTNEEWMACVDDGGCSHTPDSTILKNFAPVIADGPRLPVIDVSFHDALEYVAWLNTKLGADVYRLPTEAEWEYAARAGTSSKFAQGDTFTKKQANFTKFTSVGTRRVSDPDRFGMPVSVDMLDAANAWGLRHMSGNVWEWTMSCLEKRHLGLSTSSAYLVHAKHATPCNRVVKGGGWTGSEEYARPAFRRWQGDTRRRSVTGFRVLREVGGS